MDTQELTFLKLVDEFNNLYAELNLDVLKSFSNPVSGLRLEYYAGEFKDFVLTYFMNGLVSIKIIVRNQAGILQSQGTFYK